jgi:magnesium-transporting ATPase (P-type)
MVALTLSLAMEPPEPDAMLQPPRDPAERVLDRFVLWRVISVAVLLVAGAYGHYLHVLADDGSNVEFARTIAVNTLVAGEAFYLFNCRRLTGSVLSWNGITGNPYVLLSVAALAALQAAFTYAPPLQAVFGTTDIGAGDWLRSLAFGAAVFAIIEAEKWVLRNRRSATPHSVVATQGRS